MVYFCSILYRHQLNAILDHKLTKPVVSFCVEGSIVIDRAQRFHKSEIRNLKSQIIS